MSKSHLKNPFEQLSREALASLYKPAELLQRFIEAEPPWVVTLIGDSGRGKSTNLTLLDYALQKRGRTAALYVDDEEFSLPHPEAVDYWLLDEVQRLPAVALSNWVQRAQELGKGVVLAAHWSLSLGAEVHLEDPDGQRLQQIIDRRFEAAGLLQRIDPQAADLLARLCRGDIGRARALCYEAFATSSELSPASIQAAHDKIRRVNVLHR